MRIVTVTAAVVLAVLAGLLVVKTRTDDRASAEVRPVSITAADTRPMLGVIGDSFAAGTALGGAGGQGFPMMVADRIGWRWGTTAIGGTGYAAQLPGSLPYDAGQVDRMVTAHPDVLVVEGSQNDGHADVEAVGTAATALYAHLRSALPRTRIVVVGPVASNSAQAAALTGLDARVGEAARAAGLPYIDAIAEGWFTDAQSALIGEDHIHPTWAGHQRIADLLGTDLTRLGVVPAPRA
jgi:lysophospholipase L1-like esterase